MSGCRTGLARREEPEMPPHPLRPEPASGGPPSPSAPLSGRRAVCSPAHAQGVSPRPRPSLSPVTGPPRPLLAPQMPGLRWKLLPVRAMESERLVKEGRAAKELSGKRATSRGASPAPRPPVALLLPGRSQAPWGARGHAAALPGCWGGLGVSPALSGVGASAAPRGLLCGFRADEGKAVPRGGRPLADLPSASCFSRLITSFLGSDFVTCGAGIAPSG